MPAVRSPKKGQPEGPKPGTAAYSDMLARAKRARLEELDRDSVSTEFIFKLGGMNLLTPLQVKMALLRIRQKRLRWSRAIREEAQNDFRSTRASLRALYESIELKKEELKMAKGALHKSQTSVGKYRSELREACIHSNVPDSSYFTRDANSSDEDYDDDTNIKGYHASSSEDSDASGH